MNNIKALVLDIDGTLTNGELHIGSTGELFKTFDVKDGFAISQMLPLAGITPIILTGRSSTIVDNRMRELNVLHIHQGITNKVETLKEIAAKNQILLSEYAYVGDDLNDFAAMNICGFKACPANAVNEIKSICDYISQFDGGQGAVRDICEVILKRCYKWEELLDLFGL